MHAAQHATFHLSVVTHWGSATLQPGDYKMYLPDEAVNQHQLKVEGQGKTVYLFPLVADSEREEGGSRLDLSEVNGQYFVKDFFSSASGKEYRFYLPKARNRQEAVARHSATSVVVN
jgi:hypothetical protein